MFSSSFARPPALRPGTRSRLKPQCQPRYFKGRGANANKELDATFSLSNSGNGDAISFAIRTKIPTVSTIEDDGFLTTTERHLF